jgi:hypothetical protein
MITAGGRFSLPKGKKKMSHCFIQDPWARARRRLCSGDFPERFLRLCRRGQSSPVAASEWDRFTTEQHLRLTCGEEQFLKLKILTLKTAH